MAPKRKKSAGYKSTAKKICHGNPTSDEENTPPKKCTKAKKPKAKLQDILKDAKLPTLPTNVLEETLNDFVTNYLALAQQSGIHTYSELTFLAILSSQDKCLTVEEIYQFVQVHFPALWQKEKDPRKRIRHVLSETRCFTSYRLPDAEPSSSDTHRASKIKTLYAVIPKTFVTKISTGAYRKTPADKKIFREFQHPWANNDVKESELWKNVSRFVLRDVYQRIQAIETSRTPLRYLNTPNRRTSVARRTSPEQDVTRNPLRSLSTPNRKSSSPRATSPEPDATINPVISLNAPNRISSAPSRTSPEQDVTINPVRSLSTPNRKTSGPSRSPAYDDVDINATFMNIDEADESKETDELMIITSGPSRSRAYDDVNFNATFMNIDEADESEETDEFEESESETIEEDEDLEEALAYIDGQSWLKELEDEVPKYPCNREVPDPVLIQAVDLSPRMPRVEMPIYVDKDVRLPCNWSEPDPVLIQVNDRAPRLPCVDKDPRMPYADKDPRWSYADKDPRLPYGDEQPEQMSNGLISLNTGWPDGFDVFRYLGVSVQLFPGLEC